MRLFFFFKLRQDIENCIYENLSYNKFMAIYELDTGNFHQQEKPANMNSESSISLVLRGIDGKSGLTKSDKAYGFCLADALRSRKLIRRGSIIVVGDGLGYNSQQLHQTFIEKGQDVKLIGLDIAPNLIKAQKKRNPSQRIIEADALQLSSLEFTSPPMGIIMNEVAADLPALKVTSNVLDHIYRMLSLKSDEEQRAYYNEYFPRCVAIDEKGNLDRLIALIKQFQLPPIDKMLHGEGIINTGPIQVMIEASKILPKGAWLWMSEFGLTDPSISPQEAFYYSQQKNAGHQEVEINFGILQQVAKRLGFKVIMGHLSHFIGIKDEAMGFRVRLDGEDILVTLEELIKIRPDLVGKTVYLSPDVVSLMNGVELKHFNTWLQRYQNQLPFIPDNSDRNSKRETLITTRVGFLLKSFYYLLAIRN